MPFYGLITPGSNGVNFLKWPALAFPGKRFTIIFDSSNCGECGRAASTELRLDSLVINERKRQQREDTPSLLAVDRQLVKIMQFIDEETGIDANKKINGRERSIADAKLPCLERANLRWEVGWPFGLNLVILFDGVVVWDSFAYR